MDDKLKIKINIADREYPLVVKNEEEKNKIQESTEKLNTIIQQYKETYVVRDMQDVLAMTALQLALQMQESENEKQTINALKEIDNTLNDFLKNI